MAPARGRRLLRSAAVAAATALFLFSATAPSLPGVGAAAVTPRVAPMWCSVKACADAGAGAACITRHLDAVTCADYASYEGVCGEAAVACFGTSRPSRCTSGTDSDCRECAAAVAACLAGFVDGGYDAAAAAPPSVPACVERPADADAACPRYSTCDSAADCGEWAGAPMACVAPSGERQCTASRCRLMAVGGLGCRPAGACTRDCRPGGYCTPIYC